MKHVIVFCYTKDELDRLTDFVRDNEDDYKFIRMYSRAGTINYGSPNCYGGNYGRVFSSRTEKAQFMLRLMFDTKEYVV